MLLNRINAFYEIGIHFPLFFFDFLYFLFAFTELIKKKKKLF